MKLTSSKFLKIRLIFIIIFFCIGCTYPQTKDSTCGTIYYDAYKYCEQVTYQTLPAEIKQLMKESECNVESGSNYDYGFTIDLNDDESPEYIFCCYELLHGPCGTIIYSKISNRWEIILMTSGFLTDCEKVLIVLDSQNEGFHNLCIDEKIVKYINGEYR